MSKRIAFLLTSAVAIIVMIAVVGIGGQVLYKSIVNTFAFKPAITGRTNETSGAAKPSVPQAAALQPTSPPAAALQPASPQPSAAQPPVSQPTNAPVTPAPAVPNVALVQSSIQPVSDQLALAAQQQQALTQQLQDQKANLQARAANQPQYKMTTDQAIAIALSAAPGATLAQAPELVDYKGTPAYQVILDRGVVYVDANTGIVLYNSVAVAAVSNPSPAKTSASAPAVSGNPTPKREDGDEKEKKDEPSKPRPGDDHGHH